MSIWSNIKSYFTPKAPSPTTVTQAVRDAGIVGTPSPIPSGITVTTTPPSGGGATYTGGGGGGRTTLSPLGQIAQERGIIGTPGQIPGITPSTGTPISPGTQTFQGTIPSSGTQISPVTGKPYGTIEPAPVGFKAQFEQFQPELPPIRRGMEFTKGKFKGMLYSDLSPFTPGEAKGLEKGVDVGEVGLYFTPGIGGALLLGLGAETIGTTKGRTMVGTTSTFLKEEYGIPKGVSTVGQYGLAVAGVGIGGLKIIGDTSKVLRLPRTGTQLVGVSQAQKEGQLTTEILFETKTKTFIGTRRDIGIAVGKTDLIKTADSGLQTGRTFTTGAFGTPAFKPTSFLKETPKPDLIRIRQFQTVSGEISKPSEVLIKKQFGEIDVITKKEGFNQLFFGRGAVGKDIFSEKAQLGKGLKQYQFIGAGKSVQKDSLTLVAGKTIPLKEGEVLKQGRGIYAGIIKRKTAEYDDIIRISRPANIRRTPLEQTFKLEFPQEVQKILQTSTGAVSKSYQIPVVRGSVLIQPQKQVQMQKGIVQTQKDILGIAQVKAIATTPRQQEREILGLAQPTRQITSQRTVPLVRQKDLQLNIPGVATTPRLTQTPRTITTPGLITPTPFRTTPFITGFPPILPPIPLFLKGRPGVSKGLLGDFTQRYTPSLTARAFDLKGVVSEKALKTGVVTPFQRRYIPTKRKPKARAKQRQPLQINIFDNRRRKRRPDWL